MTEVWEWVPFVLGYLVGLLVSVAISAIRLGRKYPDLESRADSAGGYIYERGSLGLLSLTWPLALPLLLGVFLSRLFWGYFEELGASQSSRGEDE